ncbi:MAG: hypothetical protein U0W24_19255 [Bacteroidales bacterium]
MRSSIIILLLILVISNKSYGTIKEDVAKTIVRVQSGNKFSTGFFWKNGSTILTTLHSLSNIDDIKVYIPKIGSWKKAQLYRVYKAGDLISVTISGYSSEYYLSERYYSRPSVDTRCFTIGYNSGSAAYIDRDFSVGLLQGNTLDDLLPSSAKPEIKSIGFPSIYTQIVYLKGNLLHGFSGSPIVDFQGKLIGIADGGLENGAAGISWCINSTHISSLEISNESAPILNQSKINSLFASEEYESKDDKDEDLIIEINDFSFKKVKTRTFAELDHTGNYSTYREMGLNQLIGLFQQRGIPYNDFSYDIYVEQTTGATIIIPSGLALNESGDFLTASSQNDDFKIYIRLENSFNIQQASINFEKGIMNETNTYNWIQDLSLSYLFPLTRPDNVIINRKAFSTTNFTKYGFEVLAAKNIAFMGLFVSIENQLNPSTLMFNNINEVAKYNLAVQLTTFTN